MSKHSNEFKKKVVEEYIRGEGGYKYLAKKYNIKSEQQIRTWVSNYKAYGYEGIERSRENKKYSFEFKLNVVELYLTTEVSYQELAISVGINNPPMITRWVNDYRIAGPDALRPKKKGRRRKVEKPKETVSKTTDATNNDTEYVKQLEDENLKLRIENAYLKELRRLRLEGTTQIGRASCRERV